MSMNLKGENDPPRTTNMTTKKKSAERMRGIRRGDAGEIISPCGMRTK